MWVQFQPGGSVVAVQASVAHGGQPPNTLVPIAGGVGCLPQPGFVAMATPVQARGGGVVVQ